MQALSPPLQDEKPVQRTVRHPVKTTIMRPLPAGGLTFEYPALCDEEPRRGVCGPSRVNNLLRIGTTMLVVSPLPKPGADGSVAKQTLQGGQAVYSLFDAAGLVYGAGVKWTKSGCRTTASIPAPWPRSGRCRESCQ